MALTPHPSLHVHPGDWLRTEIIEPHGFNVSSMANHLKVSRQTMSKLLNGHQDLTADMAIRFEKAFGIKADTLLRMQAAYGLAQARRHQDAIAVERVAA